MQTFPNKDEIKGYNNVFVIVKSSNEIIELLGKPIRAKAINAANEIIIETDKGYYSFDDKDLLSVQFLK